MPVQFEILLQAAGFRGKGGRFISVDDRARQIQETEARELARKMLRDLQKESPKGRYEGWDGRNERKRFRDSWEFAVARNPQGVAVGFRNRAHHAGYVLFPTRPHLIEAEGKDTSITGSQRYLMFRAGGAGSGGDLQFRKSVYHPGTPGNPVHRRVWSQYGGEFRHSLQRMSVQVLESIRESF